MAAILIDAILLLVLLTVTVYWVRELFPISAARVRYRRLRSRLRIAQEQSGAPAPQGPDVEGDLARQLPGTTL